MTDYIHLLVTSLAARAVSRMMQSLGARYVGYVNAGGRRTGALWEGRYKACLVDHDRFEAQIEAANVAAHIGGAARPRCCGPARAAQRRVRRRVAAGSPDRVAGIRPSQPAKYYSSDPNIKD